MSIARALAKLAKGVSNGSGEFLLPDAFRNKIINGDFNHWYRSASQNASGILSVDRFSIDLGTGAGTFSRVALAVGGQGVPNNPRLAGRLAVTTPGNGQSVSQRVEDVGTLAGKKATLTAYVRSSVALNIGASLTQEFGNSGSANVVTTHPTVISTQAKAAGEALQKLQWVFDVPDISSKVMGSANDCLRAALTVNAPGSAYQMDVAHVSLVAGDARSEFDPFTPRQIGEEIRLCQRFYSKVQGSIIGYAAAGGQIGGRVFWPVNMRASPSVNIVVVAGQLNLGNPIADGATMTGCRVYGAVTAAGNGYIDLFEVSANAEFPA